MMLFPAAATANSGGITSHSGIEGSTCRRCHAGANYDYREPAIVGPVTVSPGAMVDYTLEFDLASGDRAVAAGFNLARSSGGGELVDPDTGLNPVHRAGSELTHSSPAVPVGGNFNWEFAWIAPSTPQAVRFYTCANPVNDDNKDSGDGSVRCTTFDICVTEDPEQPCEDLDLPDGGGGGGGGSGGGGGGSPSLLLLGTLLFMGRLRKRR